MNQKSAIFDMDGTLVDSMTMWASVGSGYLKSLGHQLTQEMEDRMRVMSLLETCQMCKDEFDLAETLEELVQGIFTRIRHFYQNEVEPRPGVVAYLDKLQAQGVEMYLATATDRPLLEAAMTHTGLSKYFKGYITCAEAGAGKDQPAIFEQALAKLQGDVETTVVYEDSVVAIRTAKAMGFQVVGIYDEVAHMHQEEIKALSDVYIQSFTEL